MDYKIIPMKQQCPKGRSLFCLFLGGRFTQVLLYVTLV